MGRKDGRMALRLLRRAEVPQTESEKKTHATDKKFGQAQASENQKNITDVRDSQQKEEQSRLAIRQGVALDPDEDLLEPQINDAEKTDEADK